MSAISTHVLDAVLGKPAAGIAIRLEKHEKQSAASWATIAEGATDSDGRCRNLCHDGSNGLYRITFAVAAYFERHARTSIYPEITIAFLVDGENNYHIPLLMSDNSYTTYRGS
jgi:5-hydroxyisourate hydrolase